MSSRNSQFMGQFRTGRLLLLVSLFIALSLSGLYVIYDRMAGHSLTMDWRLLSPQTVCACIALLFVYFCADGLRLYYCLATLGYRIPAAAVARLVFINLFFSNVTPMATGGGVAQVVFLHRLGVPVGAALTATTMRTVVAVIFIFSATPVFFLGLGALDAQTFSRLRMVFLTLFVIVYLGFFAVVLLRTRWLMLPLLRCTDGLHRLHLIDEQRRRRWRFACMREMLRFARGFRRFMHGSPQHIALVFLFTFVFLLSLFSFPAVLLDALGYSVDYLTTLGLLTVTTFIMYFSPTPGASGIAEGVFGHFFAASVGQGHLVLVTAAWRFLTIYLGMLIGMVIMQRMLLRRGKRNAQP